MDDEHPHLVVEAPATLARLAQGGGRRDDHITDELGFVLRAGTGAACCARTDAAARGARAGAGVLCEGEHIGGGINPAVLAVQPLDLLVVGDQHAQLGRRRQP